MTNPPEISKLIADIKASSEYWGEMARIDFAQLLNDEMHKQKMSQKQLAAKLGVSSAYIHKILAGESNCTLHNMARLMLALGKRLRISCAPLGDSPAEAIDTVEKLARMPEEFAAYVRAMGAAGGGGGNGERQPDTKAYRYNQDASRSDTPAE